MIGEAVKGGVFSVVATIVVGCLVIVFVALVFYKQFRGMVTLEADVRHAMLVEQTIGDVLASLLDAETGQRGFLITNDTKYLAPYYSALASIGGKLSSLREVIGDNQKQRERADELDPLIAAKLTELARSITVHTRDGAEASRAFVQSNDGIGRMDGIRSLLNAMSAAEARLLAERQQDYQIQIQVTIATMLILVLTCIVLFLTVVLLVRRQARQHAIDASEHARSAAELAASVEALQRERNHIAEINEMASLLQSCNSLEELGQVARGTLGRLFGGADGALYLHAPSRNQLVLLVCHGEEPSASILRPEECWSLRRGGAHHHRAAGDVPACTHGHEQGPDADTLCLPLIAHGETSAS